MTFTESIRTVLSKYATFSGRARRAEYWWWALGVVLLSIAANILDAMFFVSNYEVSTSQDGFSATYQGGVLGTIVTLGTLIPYLAVGVRRMHDTNHSGWWLLIILIPVLGLLYSLYLLIKPGDVGPNRFGADPLAAERDRYAHFDGPNEEAHDWQHDRPFETNQTPQPLDSSPEPATKEAQDTERPSWRSPTTHSKGFQTTQDRFRNKD